MDKEDAVRIYNGTLLSHKRMNDGICIKVDGPRDYHTKGSKSEKGKYCTVSLARVI